MDGRMTDEEAARYACSCPIDEAHQECEASRVV